MVDDADVAWHAGENNHTHLGMEIAQPRADSPYSDDEYRAAALLVRDWCDKYGIPKVHVRSQSERGIIGHEETAQGRRAGKSDPGRAFNWDYFMRLVREETATPPADGRVVGEGFRAFLLEHPDAGTPRHDEEHALYGNGYVWLTPTPACPRGAVPIWRKWLNRTKLVRWESGAAELAPGSLGDYLAAHPDIGSPRHEEHADLYQNWWLWLTPSASYPHGALLVWRRWLDAVQLVSWEDSEGAAVATRPVRDVVSQCQVERSCYDSEEDYQVWAAPRDGETRFETASCSAAALAAVLTAYGRPTNITGAVRILGPGRISPAVGLLDATMEGMLQALAAAGVAAERSYLGYDDLLGWLGEGTPIVLNLPRMFGFGHILVAVSGDAGGCELADSARRERPRWRASRADLEGYSARGDRRLAGLRHRA